MTLSVGSRLGPYEAVSPIGAGGMGEVWRARDTRLERDVAIKILPADFAANAQFRLRFEREAKTISQLNHPNVCTLFDVGHHEGTDFLVMELMEGKSLADKLLDGALPLDQVLRYGTEIASALDAAHRQGIVHRDLKPANVMLTRAGAKLLDFGLAKSGPLVSATAGVSLLADQPTQRRALTEQGTILGTFQYMAPEQLEGQEADARTDIFAFGALLYETATGRRAFQGKNKTSLIAAIVSAQPVPVTDLAPLTPPALDHVIRKCLEKDPEDRWQSIHDVADQLRWIAAAGSRAGETAPVAARRRTRMRLAWTLHLVTALVAVAATLAAVRLTRDVPRVVRTSILPPEKNVIDTTAGGGIALSPDGTRLVFAGRDETGSTRLFLRPLEAATAQPIAGTESGSFPFWSPDSRSIGFFSNGKLRKVSAAGGPPQVLCDARSGRGGTWSVEDVILFAPSEADPIFRVPATGGTPVQVTTLDLEGGQSTHRFPWFLPDGKHFLFLADGKADTPGTASGFAAYAGSIESKAVKQVVATNAAARHAKSGHLLFLRDRALVAQPFDSETLSLTGEAVPLAENVVRTTRYEAAVTVSDTGLLVIQEGDGNELSQLLWVDRSGRDLGPVGKPANIQSFALSNDGRRVAVQILDPQLQKPDIWVLDLARGTSTRLTFDPESDFMPAWSPDDRYVYFSSTRDGRADLYRKSSSGTGVDELVLRDSESKVLSSISPDGRLGLVRKNTAGVTGYDIFLLSLPDGKLTGWLQTPFAENFPAFSPDGKWVAYSSNESGRLEVFVQSVAPGGGKFQISTEGGYGPGWLNGGRELVFMTLEDHAMSVDVTFAPEFSASVPKKLFDANGRSIPGKMWTATPDGTRFLINRGLDEEKVSPLLLVQNWTAALGR